MSIARAKKGLDNLMEDKVMVNGTELLTVFALQPQLQNRIMNR